MPALSPLPPAGARPPLGIVLLALASAAALGLLLLLLVLRFPEAERGRRKLLGLLKPRKEPPGWALSRDRKEGG